MPTGPAVPAREAERKEDAADHRDVEQQLQRRGELDHREVAAGIFQHHRLMHHGQFQVRRGIVDRDARRSRPAPR